MSLQLISSNNPLPHMPQKPTIEESEHMERLRKMGVRNWNTQHFSEFHRIARKAHAHLRFRRILDNL